MSADPVTCIGSARLADDPMAARSPSVSVSVYDALIHTATDAYERGGRHERMTLERDPLSALDVLTVALKGLSEETLLKLRLLRGSVVDDLKTLARPDHLPVDTRTRGERS